MLESKDKVSADARISKSRPTPIKNGGVSETRHTGELIRGKSKRGPTARTVWFLDERNRIPALRT